MKFFLFVNTIRYLKFIQIFHRIKAFFWKPSLKSNAIHFSVSKRRLINVQFLKKNDTLIPPHTFSFFGREYSLLDIGWNNPNEEMLWRYNQHYFDGLLQKSPDCDSDWKTELIVNWILGNPPVSTIGWDPYPCSLRIVNWIKYFVTRNWVPSPDIQISLFLQLRWLNSNLEYGILGNHLFVNAKALIIGGLYFGGTEASKWLSRGLQIIDKEIQEQVMDDGAHIELSPMYHGLFIEDVLDLLNFLSLYPDKVDHKFSLRWSKFVPPLIAWLENVVHPDGEISFFNDSSVGVSQTVEDLKTYAIALEVCDRFLNRRNQCLHLMADSGIVRVSWEDSLFLIDSGKIGPDYLPAHAHADSLSFEMSYLGQRVMVNSGTSSYELGSIRQSERGTRAHNTVVVNNTDSSEVWAQFRVARRARIRRLSIKEDLPEEIFITACHDGYCRRFNDIIHTRTWKFSKSKIEIIDKLSGNFKSAYASFHFHPDIDIEKFDEDSVVLRSEVFGSVIVECAGFPICIEPYWYGYSFGRRIKSRCLRVDFMTKNCLVTTINLR